MLDNATDEQLKMLGGVIMDRDFVTRCILRELVFQANKHFVASAEDRAYLHNLDNYDDIPQFCYEVLNRVYHSGMPLKKIDQLFADYNSHVKVASDTIQWFTGTGNITCGNAKRAGEQL